MWTIFKVFIEFDTILLLFYILVFWPRVMWDLSSLTRDRTCTPCIGRRSLNHPTAREVLHFNILNVLNTHVNYVYRVCVCVFFFFYKIQIILHVFLNLHC